MGFNPSTMEYLPEAAAAAGFVVGAASDFAAQHGIAAERQRLSESWPDLVEAQQPSRLTMWRRAAVGALAISGAAFGFANGYAWHTDAGPKHQPGHLEVVVDHSGATLQGEPSAASEIASIVTQLSRTPLETEAVIASAGEVTIKKGLKDVAKDDPFGDAPLAQAVKTAQDNNAVIRSQATSGNRPRTAGLVFITNGNSAGTPSELVTASHGSPFFVVNVEGDASPATKTELQTIAKETNAKYWDANAKTADEVAKQVRQTLTQAEVRNTHTTNWPGRAAAGVLTVIGFPLVYRNRRRMPLTFNGLGNKGE